MLYYGTGNKRIIVLYNVILLELLKISQWLKGI
jgi:hypothetical protein